MRWFPDEKGPEFDEFCQAVCVLVTLEDVLAGQLEHGVDMTAPRLAAIWAERQLRRPVAIRSHTEMSYTGKNAGALVYLA